MYPLLMAGMARAAGALFSHTGNN